MALPELISFSKPVNYEILEQFPLKIRIDSTENLPVYASYKPLSKYLLIYQGSRDIRQYEPSDIPDPKKIPAENLNPGLLEGYPDLYRVGSITRGFSVGNRQNLFVNSALNLQLQGKISDDLTLTASITDQNIPYQPEGNTQQLRDFDNVYISLAGKKSKITAGDITIQNSANPYFLKYYKNQQGFQIKDQRPVFNDWKSVSTVSAGIAKGRFASTRLDPIEGVNGPYRLRGAQNERFIIVIANSEKVFLDGKQLQRGYNADYVIDYNLGELTFTSRVVITRFSRLRVDFEYTNLNFQRSNIQFSQSLSNDKHSFFVEFFRAADDPGRPLQYELSDSLSTRLSELGDPVGNQLFLTQTRAADINQPGNYYQKVDTTINGSASNIFVYQPSGEGLLRVPFTETSNGNYIVSDQNAYGRIYSYIAPVNGVPQGNYTPAIEIILPQSQSMVTVGNRHQLSKAVKIQQEIAISDNDLNVYSNKDQENNVGLAWTGGITVDKKWGSNSSLKAESRGEFNSKSFRPIDRFRTIEFDRDWNYPFPYDSVQHAEQLLYTKIELKHNQQNIAYENIYRKRTDILEGWQHSLRQQHQLGIFHYNGNHFLMNNEQVLYNAHWLKSFNEAYIDIQGNQLGVYFDIDQNQLKSNTEQNKIIGSAMYYDEKGFFTRRQIHQNLGFDIRYANRTDFRPIEGINQQYTSAQQIKGSLQWSDSQKAHSVNFQGVYRDTKRTDSISLPNDQILQGSASFTNQFWNGNIKNKLSYMTQNSRELRREYIYSQVGTGQGTHTWRDENNNGIAEINEFYEAINPDEKNFIRLFVPTDDYIEAFLTQYQHSIDWVVPSETFKSDLLKPLNLISGVINWNIQSKNASNDVIDRSNPFFQPPDSVLISRRAFETYSIFYNRFNKGLGINYNYSKKGQKQLNVNGFESDFKAINAIAFRYMFNHQLQLDFSRKTGSHQHEADFLENRNFELSLIQNQLKASWMPSLKTRLTFDYIYKDNINNGQENKGEFSNVNEWKGGITFIEPGKRNVNLEMALVTIDFDGVANSYLGYVLLDALQPGENLKLNINLNQTLKNGLQLNLSYFGRKSENQPIIHTGSMNLTAFF